MSDFVAGVRVLVHEDHAEVRIPSVGEPIIVRPGEVFAFDYRLSHEWDKQPAPEIQEGDR